MDDKDDEIEVVNSELTLSKALGMIFLGLFLLGLLAFGGLKLYKHFKSSSSNVNQEVKVKMLATNNVNAEQYTEELAKDLEKKIPAPKNLNLPPPNTVKAKVGLVSLPTIVEENLEKEIVVKTSKRIETKKIEILTLNSFKDLEAAILNQKVLLLDDEVKIRNISYKVNDEFGSFIIKKIYKNRNVKFFNKDEKYSRRFSL
jgi:hypothetical protein